MGNLRWQTNSIAKGDWPMSLIRSGPQSLSLILMNALTYRFLVHLRRVHHRDPLSAFRGMLKAMDLWLPILELGSFIWNAGDWQKR